MAARSLASLTLSFGLVSIPVRVYSATESSATVRFNMLAADGSRLKQQYVNEKTRQVVERADMVKGYEFEPDRFVLFTPDELKALDEGARHSIDIVSFVPEKSVDPIYYDKAYFLAPDKRGGKPYALLLAAMRESGRCALARWAWKSKQYVVQVRSADDGLVLQQLLYADEVRSMKELAIEPVAVAPAELTLALQLIDQIAQPAYEPAEFKDDEKQRILAAIDEKIAGKQIVASEHAEEGATVGGGQLIDLMEALRASIGGKRSAAKAAPSAPAVAAPAAAPSVVALKQPAARPAAQAKDRKAVKRAPVAEPVAEPVRARARK